MAKNRDKGGKWCPSPPHYVDPYPRNESFPSNLGCSRPPAYVHTRKVKQVYPAGCWYDLDRRVHIPVEQHNRRPKTPQEDAGILTYYCPACRKKHIHGTGSEPDPLGVYWRFSHCLKGPLAGVPLTLIVTRIIPTEYAR